MKTKSIIIIALFLINGAMSVVFAQENVNVTGGNSTGSGGSVSYSIGQVFYQTYFGDNTSVAEGVQQPFEIFTLSSVPGVCGIALKLSVFPNPTTDYLVLSIDNLDISDLSYQLFDTNGKSLQNREF